MPERIARVLLAVLAVNSAAIGLWATVAPQAFYDNFPGGSHTWVALDGPYNEHLVRDIGELNLALTVVTLFALFAMSRQLILTTAAAWLVYGVPHLVYHLRHLDRFSGIDKTSIPIGLAAAVVSALLLLRRPAHARSESRGELVRHP
jgi:hypothetical protein